MGSVRRARIAGAHQHVAAHPLPRSEFATARTRLVWWHQFVTASSATHAPSPRCSMQRTPSCSPTIASGTTSTPRPTRPPDAATPQPAQAGRRWIRFAVCGPPRTALRDAGDDYGRRANFVRRPGRNVFARPALPKLPQPRVRELYENAPRSLLPPSPSSAACRTRFASPRRPRPVVRASRSSPPSSVELAYDILVDGRLARTIRREKIQTLKPPTPPLPRHCRKADVIGIAPNVYLLRLRGTPNGSPTITKNYITLLGRTNNRPSCSPDNRGNRMAAADGLGGGGATVRVSIDPPGSPRATHVPQLLQRRLQYPRSVEESKKRSPPSRRSP